MFLQAFCSLEAFVFKSLFIRSIASFRLIAAWCSSSNAESTLIYRSFECRPTREIRLSLIALTKNLQVNHFYLIAMRPGACGNTQACYHHAQRNDCQSIIGHSLAPILCSSKDWIFHQNECFWIRLVVYNLRQWKGMAMEDCHAWVAKVCRLRAWQSGCVSHDVMLLLPFPHCTLHIWIQVS